MREKQRTEKSTVEDTRQTRTHEKVAQGNKEVRDLILTTTAGGLDAEALNVSVLGWPFRLGRVRGPGLACVDAAAGERLVVLVGGVSGQLVGGDEEHVIGYD